MWEDHTPAKKFARFNKDDPLNMETLLTEEEIMIKDSVRDFCDERLVPRVLEGFRNEEFDRSMVRLPRAFVAAQRRAIRSPSTVAVGDACTRR